MESTSTASSWLSTTNPSFYNVNVNSNSPLRSNGGFRKRKVAATDLDEKTNQKMFATEEKVIREMRTLSLELNKDRSDGNVLATLVEDDLIVDDVKSDSVFIEEEILNEKDTNPIRSENNEIPTYEFHPMLKDKLTKDNMHDALIRQLCENERKKLSMQLVPYVAIHPGQLNRESSTETDEKLEKSPRKTDQSKVVTSNENEDIQIDNDDQLFKKPSIPTIYTVEEPCEGNIKRASTMKRSFSQCNQYNGHLFVTELNNDSKDDLSIRERSSSYFIVEPSTPASFITESNNFLSPNGNSLRITEFNDVPTLIVRSNNVNDLDDDIDMQSVSSTDTGDKMDDD